MQSDDKGNRKKYPWQLNCSPNASKNTKKTTNKTKLTTINKAVIRVTFN